MTKGTNSDDEKSRMIAKGMDMLKNIVGNTADASYIVTHEIKADSWGYDRQTQQARASN